MLQGFIADTRGIHQEYIVQSYWLGRRKEGNGKIARRGIEEDRRSLLRTEIFPAQNLLRIALQRKKKGVLRKGRGRGRGTGGRERRKNLGDKREESAASPKSSQKEKGRNMKGKFNKPLVRIGTARSWLRKQE